MKTRIQSLKLGFSALALGVCGIAFAQGPVISSFSQNGQLDCTNLPPGSLATVEWASSVAGPWTNSWAGLDSIVVGSNSFIQVSVPMFYRVRVQTNVPPPQNMVLIPAGWFAMGNSMDMSEGTDDELPMHSAYVSAFYMDAYEVTKALWDEVHLWATNHGYGFEFGAEGKLIDHPAQRLTWYDAVKWCNARSEKEGRTPAYFSGPEQTNVYRSGQVDVQVDWVKWNSGYRLPTEAEWEKAARGNLSGHRFPWADVEAITHGRANYFSATNYSYDTSLTRGYNPAFSVGSLPFTSPVGYFAPNNYGLYDMAGNVWEWCWDKYGAYPSAPQTDPRGSAIGSTRTIRGGGWDGNGSFCRSAFRTDGDPTFRGYSHGFRSVLSASN